MDLENSVAATEISRYDQTMIGRVHELQIVERMLRQHPVVAITGARQVGKTTFARQIAAARKTPVTFFDLEAIRGRSARKQRAKKFCEVA
jgi:predicted AAA+ superfamily ATPase